MKKLLVLLLLVFTLGVVGQEKDTRKVEKVEILSPFKIDSIIGVAKSPRDFHMKLDSVNKVYRTNRFHVKFYFTNGQIEIKRFVKEKTVLKDNRI